MISTRRVFFLPKWYPNPGDPQLGVFLREHAEALAEKTSLSVLYAYPDPELRESFKIRTDHSRGFTELIVHYRARGSMAVRSFRYLRAMLRAWRTLIRNEGWPDLLHAHILNRPALFAYLIQLRHGIPFLVSEQWSGFLDGRASRRSWISRQTTSLLLNKAHAVSAVSEPLSRALKEWSSIEAPWIIPNMTLDPGPPSDIPSAPFRFFNISDMVDELKGLSNLIEAFHALKKEREESVELHIVGGGPDEKKIKELASEKGLLGKGLHLYGRLENEEVHERFPGMSALVVNSLHETFSVVTVEALVHGRPVIASKCGGPEEILKDEDHGFLFQKGSIDATKEAMHRIMDRIDDFDPEMLHRHAIKHYGRQAVRDRFLELYRKALKA